MSGGVEAVSRQCRLTPVSVCRAVSGCSVGAVSGLLDSGDVRTVSRCQAVSECRSVGVSGCRSGVEVSECRCPTQTASILSYFEGAGPSTSGVSPSDSMTKLPYKATEVAYYTY